MYFTLLISYFALLQLAQAGQPADVCNAPSKEVLISLTPKSIEHIHSLEICSHSHDHLIPQSSTWSHPVKCIPKENSTETFCVYTDAKFANGRGISFFTKPSVADRILSSPAYTKKNVHKHANKFDDAPWEIRTLEGRGRGLFATRTLQRGDPILADTPMGVYNTQALVPDSMLEYTYLHTAFIQLPGASQSTFLRNIAGPGGAIMGRVSANAFSDNFEGEAHLLMYPETAMMNHDCRPNAMYYYNPKTLVHTTTAARTIEVGEEITIPYINIMQTHAERKTMLSQYWGFECSCSLCSAAGHIARASDMRLSKIVELQTALADWSPWSTGTPEMAEELIALYEKEGIHAAKAVGHTLAALAYNAVGDNKVAEFHAEFALEAGMVNKGTDDDDVKAMKLLLEDPAAHWSYRVRARRDEL